MITAKEYFDATGMEPQDDDLERANCDKYPTIGHMGCGWCADCQKPFFLCYHFASRVNAHGKPFNWILL